MGERHRAAIIGNAILPFNGLRRRRRRPVLAHAAMRATASHKRKPDGVPAASRGRCIESKCRRGAIEAGPRRS